MSERLFLCATALLGAACLLFAATQIKARIQYDPLGPETWPMIIGSVLTIASLARLFRPVGASPDLTRPVFLRLIYVLVPIILYAWLFEHLGFVLSTWGFCAAVTMLLGTRAIPAMIFGSGTAVSVYLLFTYALELKLPAGPLAFLG